MSEETISAVLRRWAKHADILPRFETFRRQRNKFGAWSCPGCGVAFGSVDAWRQRTELVEEFTLIAGGRVWERRRCTCGNTKSLPARGGSHAKGRH